MSLRVSTLQKYDENIKISKLNNELRFVYSFTLEQVFFSFGDFLYPLLGLRISFFSRFFVEYLFLILSSFYRFQSFTYLQYFSPSIFFLVVVIIFSTKFSSRSKFLLEYIFFVCFFCSYCVCNLPLHSRLFIV